METYLFVEKNGPATLTLSATSEENAEEQLAELVISPLEWRLEGLSDYE